MTRTAQQQLAGWGNYCHEPCSVFRPSKQRHLHAMPREGGQSSYISRGLGRSYGDSAVNADAGVILHTRLDRMLAFDHRSDILECEAGVSFEKIIKTFVPRGYFLPVTPGTKFVTLGGAIAADVHGKNHHRVGSIAQFIESFDLITAGGDRLTCSCTQNRDLFFATLGGMGLTGAIISARLRLKRIESAYVNVSNQKLGNLDAALDAMNEGDSHHEYSVAWIDCLAGGASLGRSVLMHGDHAAAKALPAHFRSAPLALPRRRSKTVPFNLPAFALNPFSVKAFNALYYRKGRDANEVVDFDSYFYPLDSIHHWNRLYGKRGFIQYQAAMPVSRSREGLVKLLEILSRSRKASFLAVLKAFGKSSDGPLSFPMPGHTLALDLPNTGAELITLVREMDEVVIDHGGRTYLAKDACMSRDAFERMYPRLSEFKRIKKQIDPNSTFSSSQARRLGLCDSALNAMGETDAAATGKGTETEARPAIDNAHDLTAARGGAA